jgi:hypothetical protein
VNLENIETCLKKIRTKKLLHLTHTAIRAGIKLFTQAQATGRKEHESNRLTPHTHRPTHNRNINTTQNKNAHSGTPPKYRTTRDKGTKQQKEKRKRRKHI